MTPMTITRTLDLKGLACPLPIVETSKVVKGMAGGELLEVFATDPGSAQDFSAWCRSTGNELIGHSREDGVFRYVIRKR